MQSYLHRVPWWAVRRASYEIREHLFTVDIPDVNHIKVDEDFDDVKAAFFQKDMRRGWLLSYNYYEEDANMVSPLYKDDDYEDYQLHVRLFDKDDGYVHVYPHTELCPINWPRKHLEEENLSVTAGIEKSKGILDDNGFQYEKVN